MCGKDLEFLFADRPLSAPKGDCLGGRYSAFAKDIADQICKMAPTAGFVIAVNGDWGSGKSTVLNFIEFYIDEVNEVEKPTIVRFNPWWFSGHEDLIRRFFNQLMQILKRGKLVERSIRKKISSLADAVSKTPIPYSEVIGTIGKIADVKEVDVVKLKQEIANALNKKKKRIVIIIDEVDRLFADEIKQLFRVIKAVADFPYITYLLAFDRKVVAKALSVKDNEREGFAYLEKIVQVPYELPMLDKRDLRQMLFSRLDKIIGDFPTDLFDKDYWSSLYNAGIDHFIRTPRSVVRFTNALHATYPVVKGEVNISDFIGIEAIRIFNPSIYDVIRDNPNMFYGEMSDRMSYFSSLDFPLPSASELKPFHEKWVSETEEKDRKALRNSAIILFPKLNRLEPGSISSEWHFPMQTSKPEDWRKHRRICDPATFFAYFRYGITEEELSRGEVINLLARANNPEDFRNGLIALSKSVRRDGTSKAKAFLERMYDYTASEIPDERIGSILEVLFDIGDQLLRPEDEPTDWFGNDNAQWIILIILNLIRRIKREQRIALLEKCILKGKSTYIQAHVITIFGWQHGLYGERNAVPENERILPLEDIEKLVSIALEKVREAAADGTLVEVPKLGRVLYRWKDWANDKEVKKWVKKAILSDEGLLKIVESFGIPLSSDFNLKALEDFVNSREIVDDVRRLLEKNGITERQKQILHKFIEAFDAKNRT